MRYIIGFCFLFLGVVGFGQVERTAGIAIGTTVPTHTPSTQGALKYYNRSSGLSYRWNGSAWVSESVDLSGYLQWSDTATLATKHYVDSQGFLTAEVDGSITNEIQQLDTFSISGTTISASLSGDGVPAKTLDIPSGITGGVAGYLSQYTSATALDTTGLFWNATTGRLGIGQAVPTARTHITSTGTTSSTTALLVENSAGTDALSVTDDGSTHVNGNLGIAGGSFIRQDGASAGGWRFNVNDIIFYNQSNNAIGIIKSSAAGGAGAFAWGTTTPDASALMTLNATYAGFLPPRMTTAQRNAISSPATGLMLFCTDCTATDGSTGVSQTYSSGTWKNHY